MLRMITNHGCTNRDPMPPGSKQFEKLEENLQEEAKLLSKTVQNQYKTWKKLLQKGRWLQVKNVNVHLWNLQCEVFTKRFLPWRECIIGTCRTSAPKGSKYLLKNQYSSCGTMLDKTWFLKLKELNSYQNLQTSAQLGSYTGSIPAPEGIKLITE